MNQFSMITSKGRTTLPSEVRADMHIGPGDRIEYVKRPDGGYEIRKAPSLRSLSGIIKLDRPVDWDEIDRLIAERRGRG